MLDRKIDHSSNNAYSECQLDRLLAILLGYFAQWMHLGPSCPHQYTVSIQIVSQIPQANLGLYPDHTNNPYDQTSRTLCLHPKNMLHSTPNSRTRPIPLSLSIRQFLVFASLPLKMLPILPFLKLPKLFFDKNSLWDELNIPKRSCLSRRKNRPKSRYRKNRHR